MIKKLLALVLLFNIATAKNITPSEVYGQVMLITDEMQLLLKHYGFKHDHDHDEMTKQATVSTVLKPRNTWQLTYEILVKINILRNQNNLPTIEPVNMTPVLNLNPDLVYEMTKRILTEIDILKYRVDIKSTKQKLQKFQGKTPIDVYNGLSHISESLDELNKKGFTPSHVFGENMRVYDDLTIILQHLNIEDKTIPAKQNIIATPLDTFNVGMEMLSKIKQLQIKSGIDFVDYSGFKKDKVTPSDVFTITGMIIAELQTIKAYIGLNDYITPAASKYNSKTPVEVDQIMHWNLRKLSLIDSLEGRK